VDEKQSKVMLVAFCLYAETPKPREAIFVPEENIWIV
jgi:hypothetical protein